MAKATASRPDPATATVADFGRFWEEHCRQDSGDLKRLREAAESDSKNRTTSV